MGFWRRTIGFTVGAATLAAGLLVPMTASAADAIAQPLIHYSFNTAPSGATIANEGTAAASDATLSGSGASVADGQITLNGSQTISVPTTALANQKDVTVSIWLKNNFGNGNTAATYIGAPQTSGSSYPTKGYWLLNPANPNGYTKSVMTTATAANPNGNPWGTEVGPGATNADTTGVKATDDMALYTTVINGTDGTMTFYRDGQKVGNDTYAIPSGGLTAYGDLVAYIAKSAYPDANSKLVVDDYAIYNNALSADDVAALYTSGAFEQAVNAVSLPKTATVDFALPATAGKAAVSWVVKSGSAITIDGGAAKVNRAAADAGNGEVTLTATFTIDGQTQTRDYTVTVADSQATLDDLAKNYDLGLSAAAADFTLPTEDSGAKITWQVVDGANAIAIDGDTARITRAKDDVTAKLKATFTVDAKTSSKTFDVRVIGEGGHLAVYPRGTDTATKENSRSQAVNLAAADKADGTFTPLNNGQPVVYPQYDNKTYARMASVLTFRMADGSVGILGEDANKPSNWMWFFTTKDFIHFDTSAAKFSTGLTGSPRPLNVTYDNVSKLYTLTYRDTVGGKTYTTTTKDFLAGSYSTAKETTATPAAATVKGLQDDAMNPTTLAVSAKDYDAVVKHYSRVVNTTVTLTRDGAKKDSATVKAGASADDVKAALDGVKATAAYTDGSTKSFNVNWNADDVKAVDTSKKGRKYTITGTVNQPTYNSPLVRERADPDMTYVPETGEYYLTGSYPMCNNNDPQGYDRVVLRHAKTINGLTTEQDKDADYDGHDCKVADNETTIWDEADSSFGRYIWAPELEKIGDSYYILFTASLTDNDKGVWNIRPVMLKFTGDLKAGDSLTDKTKWTLLGRVKAADGDNIAFSGFSLDMTHFTANGKDYLAWAQTAGVGDSSILVGQIDPNDPTQLISHEVVLTKPEYVWEKQNQTGGDTRVNEGPAVIKHDGKVYLFFSNAAVDTSYCLSYLTIDEDGDILNPDAWYKNKYPMLGASDFTDRMGTGHNSFSVDENGNPVIVYHARLNAEPVDGSSGNQLINGGLWDPRRHAFIKTVHFAADGTPVLNQTAGEELKDANKTVTFTITVEDDTVTVNKADLQKAYDAVKDYRAADYKAGWNAFVAARDAAAKVLADAAASQDDVNGALDALDAAVSGLKKADGNGGAVTPKPDPEPSDKPGSGSGNGSGGSGNGGVSGNGAGGADANANGNAGGADANGDQYGGNEQKSGSLSKTGVAVGAVALAAVALAGAGVAFTLRRRRV
ncbi:family 43 glycosylhydrolase [Bifidobacterium catulorum]|uniref:Uncharacterized protein n=1 Tax=Bifidobacterium catulorum TaxID=1630173 RepID=A0A2U2MQN9_9BIFI|nr:family 43 glycosylhydrolase [Bifidobacterium catulorum]PWG59161.1 hypothetical protein DF200_09035 [Bifidobacterium catulorum]